MLSPKHLPKYKPAHEDPLKLPKIPSRKQIHSVKKNTPPLPNLPQIKDKAIKQNLSVNKQNNSLNLLQRRNSLDEEIKARLFDVEAAEKVVKNVLGDPQATVQVGGDMTNFELKIQVNRGILRKQRNKSHFTPQDQNLPTENSEQNLKQPKLKSVSSKDIVSDPEKQISIRHDMKLRILQNKDSNIEVKKIDSELQSANKEKQRFKSERRHKNLSKAKNDEDSKVFKSIKQILQDPSRMNLELEAKKVKKIVKFTIQELENRLKQMQQLKFNQSTLESQPKSGQSSRFQRKLTTAKSAGMIPVVEAPIGEDYTFKNWNKVQFSQPQQQQLQQRQIGSNKVVKYHKSDFEQEVDQIQKLQMRSYKSIQKMVENRKLLIDLNLLNAKNRSCVMTTQKRGQKKTNEASL